MANAISIASSTILRLVFPVGLLVLAILNFESVNQAFRDLLAMTARIQSMKTTWVEFTLKDKEHLAVSLEGRELRHLSGEARKAVIAAVKGLNGLRVERLFSIEDGSVHCSYAAPTPEMRMYAAVDFDLEGAALIHSTVSAASRAAVGKSYEPIGKALSCYEIHLTDLGINVKSALLGVLRDGFDGSTASAEAKP
ncbi:hypothetical protein [Methylobacterium sp. JK268]